MTVNMKTATQLMEEAKRRHKLTTGNEDLDALLGGIEPGQLYMFYGNDQAILDLLLHKLLSNCVLPEDMGGFNSKALYLNVCNYYEGKTILNPDTLAVIAKSSGVEPRVVMDNIYSLFAFNEGQLRLAGKKALETIENDPDIRLIVVHNLTRFFSDSRNINESREIIKEVVSKLRQSSAEHGIALVVSSEASEIRGRRVPRPRGGTFLQHIINTLVFLEKREATYFNFVKAHLLKHPSKKTPQTITLSIPIGGVDLMGRVTPSFRQLYQAQIDELKRFYQSALLDPGHREAFDLLLKDAWTAEDHAMSNSRIPAVLDSMNLMANVHNRKLIEFLEDRMNTLEKENIALKHEIQEMQDEVRVLAVSIKTKSSL